jgi:hypothetical protein
MEEKLILKRQCKMLMLFDRHMTERDKCRPAEWSPENALSHVCQQQRSNRTKEESRELACPSQSRARDRRKDTCDSKTNFSAAHCRPSAAAVFYKRVAGMMGGGRDGFEFTLAFKMLYLPSDE